MIEAPVYTEQFSKDHWSTLAFVETRCVDDGGKLDKARMRCNLERHATFADMNHVRNWSVKYGTILKDGTVLPDHDDWDCLIDLAKEGYIHIIDIDDGTVELTDKGWMVAHQLRRHITHGNYKDFEPVLV